RAQEKREDHEQRHHPDDGEDCQHHEHIHRLASPPTTQSGHPGHWAAWAPMAAVAPTMPFAEARMSPARGFVVSSNAIWMVLLATCCPMVQIVATPSRTFRAACRTRVSSTATTTRTTA